MAEKVVNDKTFRDRYLDVLYELKFKLSIKKIEGNTYIPKLEFKKMIDDETEKDLEVRNAIDKLFEPLHIYEKKTSEPVQEFNNQIPISTDYAENMVNNEIGNQLLTGPTLTKTLPQFKNKNDNKTTEQS